MADDTHAITDGARLEAFLDDPLIQNAIDRALAANVTDWENAQTPDLRDDAWHDRHALKRLLRELRKTIGDGEVAAARRAKQA